MFRRRGTTSLLGKITRYSGFKHLISTSLSFDYKIKDDCGAFLPVPGEGDLPENSGRFEIGVGWLNSHPGVIQLLHFLGFHCLPFSEVSLVDKVLCFQDTARADNG